MLLSVISVDGKIIGKSVKKFKLTHKSYLYLYTKLLNVELVLLIFISHKYKNLHILYYTYQITKYRISNTEY